MWKELTTDTIDDRTTLRTFEATLPTGQRAYKTVTAYRNRDGSVSLCSDTIIVEDAKPERRSSKKEA